MKEAVVGTRDYPDMDKVHSYLRDFHEWTEVVSGGSGDVDEAAEGSTLHYVSFRPFKVAQGFAIRRVEVIEDGWDGQEVIEERVGELRSTYASACYYRNELIVLEVPKVTAFWDGKSKGTKHTIDIALREGRDLEVFFP